MEMKISNRFVTMTEKEMNETQGGNPWLIAVAIVTAYVAFYQLGKAVGETAYYLTH